MTATTNDTEPRGWVGCLGCYNAGNLIGEWVTAAEAAELPDVCPRCGSDEFDVFDTDGLRHPGGYYSVADFIRDAEALEECDDPDALIAWADNLGVSLPDAAETFEDAYQGRWASLRDYVEEFHDDTYGLDNLPDWVRYHIDWDGIARDWEMSGDVWTADAGDGNVFVFWENA